MAIQDKIESRTIKLRRKLADKSIKVMGSNKTCLRLKIVKDEFGGTDSMDIINQDKIDIKIVFPTEVPLFRFRNPNVSNQVIESDTGVYLFDILPIEIFTKFEDNVEKGDIVCYDLTDENDNKIYLVLQIGEMLGTFRQHLSWKKYQAHIYTGQYTTAIDNVLANLDTETP